LPYWLIAHNKIRCSGPKSGRTLEVEFLGEFESIFGTALDNKTGERLGTFGEITLDKKSYANVPLRLFEKEFKLEDIFLVFD
jgi:hypothetical protein